MIPEPLARWEGWDVATLAARWGAPVVHAYRRVGSTNDLARHLAAAGGPDGAVVLAEEQTAGRGRAGRAWSSPPALGLWLSVLRRPGADFQPGALPLRVGLAAAAALDPFLDPARAELKWPNDLLAGGRKLGGILCEGVWEAGAPVAVIVGLGVNLLHEPAHFPEELRDAATSVAIAGAAPPARIAVADALIPALLALPLAGVLTPAERGAFAARDALRDREVVVSEPATGEPRLAGVALGPDPDGTLRLRLAPGTERTVHSGTVRLAGASAPTLS